MISLASRRNAGRPTRIALGPSGTTASSVARLDQSAGAQSASAASERAGVGGHHGVSSVQISGAAALRAITVDGWPSVSGACNSNAQPERNNRHTPSASTVGASNSLTASFSSNSSSRNGSMTPAYGRIDSTRAPSTLAAADTSESASRSEGSSTTRSSVAWPSERSTMSTLRMSAPAWPSADANAPSAPGRSGSTTLIRYDTSTVCRVEVSGKLTRRLALDSDPVSEQRPTITRDEVAHLARLARLDVTDDELDLFAGQLDVILGSIARIGEVAAADIEPTSHAVPLQNVLRPDVVVASLDRDAVLAGAPAVEVNRFRVPQILGEEE